MSDAFLKTTCSYPELEVENAKCSKTMSHHPQHPHTVNSLPCVAAKDSQNAQTMGSVYGFGSVDGFALLARMVFRIALGLDLGIPWAVLDEEGWHR